MTRKLVFLGCSHTAGEGSEWPSLCDYVEMPSKFQPKHRYPYLREQYSKDNINATNQTHCRRDFVDFLNTRFDGGFSEDSRVQKYRQTLSWPTLLGDMLGIPVENLGRPGASNDLCLTQLMRYVTHNSLDGCLVVFSSTYMHRHFIQTPSHCDGTYHHHDVNRQLDELEIQGYDWRINELARIIWLMSTFCRSNGARFVWAPFDEYLISPISGIDFWNTEHSYFSQQAGKHCISFEPIAYQLSEEFSWRRFDGHHFDSVAQREVARVYQKLLDFYI